MSRACSKFKALPYAMSSLNFLRAFRHFICYSSSRSLQRAPSRYTILDRDHCRSIDHSKSIVSRPQSASSSTARRNAKIRSVYSIRLFVIVILRIKPDTLRLCVGGVCTPCKNKVCLSIKFVSRGFASYLHKHTRARAHHAERHTHICINTCQNICTCSHTPLTTRNPISTTQHNSVCRWHSE